MALGDPYISHAELKDYLAISGSADDPLLRIAVDAASQQISNHCGRDFNKVAAATARRFRPTSAYLVNVDDFHSTASLVIKTDTADDASYATTWTSSDYELEPFDGVVDGITGFPYRLIHAVGALTFPCTRRPRSVQVTALWGWASVPEPVKSATFILAAQLFNLKNSPLGVAGFGEFGVVRVRDIPQVEALLAKYRHPVNTGPIAA